MKIDFAVLRASLLELESIASDLEGGREMALVKTSLQRARMFSGKTLGLLGSITPYSSNKSTVDDIEDRAEAEPVYYNWADPYNPIKTISSFRRELEDMAEELWSQLFSDAPKGITDKQWIRIRTTVSSKIALELQEARMWLGECLHNIKNQA